MDDTDNLELPGPDNYVWRNNGAASYSRFYTGFQHSVQHFVMDTLFLSNCRGSNDANCRQIIRYLWQEKDIAHSHGSILYRHFSRRIRKQHRIHACSKSNYNSKLWVSSHILFNISYSSYTWPGDQKDPSRHKAGNLTGESRGRGRK